MMNQRRAPLDIDIENFDRIPLPAVRRLCDWHGVLEQIANDVLVDNRDGVLSESYQLSSVVTSLMPPLTLSM